MFEDKIDDILRWLYLRIIFPIAIVVLAIYSIAVLVGTIGGLLYVAWLVLR